MAKNLYIFQDKKNLYRWRVGTNNKGGPVIFSSPGSYKFRAWLISSLRNFKKSSEFETYSDGRNNLRWRTHYNQIISEDTPWQKTHKVPITSSNKSFKTVEDAENNFKEVMAAVSKFLDREDKVK